VKSTAIGETTPRLRLVLVATQPPGEGIGQGRVWDLDTGTLAEATSITRRRIYGCTQRCAACGSEDHEMLVVEHEGRELAWCDNGYCSLAVSEVLAFEPHGSFEGLDGIEHMGLYSCACGRLHIVGGPAGNWTLAYCPEPCGRGVLARPEMPALARRAS
jgi:hypothetical protein